MQAIHTINGSAVKATARPKVTVAALPQLPAVRVQTTPRRSVPSPRQRVISFSDAGSSAPAPAAEPAATPAPQEDDIPEEVYYEGNGGSNIELALNLLLGLTLIYAPLTIASIGRRLWFKLRVTNKRLVVIKDSPVVKEEVQISYKNIKEIRTVQRGFGAWGDMVVFLKNGNTIDLVGLEKATELKAYMEARMKGANL